MQIPWTELVTIPQPISNQTDMHTKTQAEKYIRKWAKKRTRSTNPKNSSLHRVDSKPVKLMYYSRKINANTADKLEQGRC